MNCDCYHGGSSFGRVLAFIKEVSGYNDLVRCAHGSASGCIWLAASAFPVGRVVKAGKAVKAAENASRAAKGGGALVDASKYDYLFGRVASGSHNAARSAQNAQQLGRVGVHNNAAGRSLLENHFDDVISRDDNIARTFSNNHGTFQIRDSLFSGPGGFLKFESTWQVTDDGLRLTTVIPMGGS